MNGKLTFADCHITSCLNSLVFENFRACWGHIGYTTVQLRITIFTARTNRKEVCCDQNSKQCKPRSHRTSNWDSDIKAFPRQHATNLKIQFLFSCCCVSIIKLQRILPPAHWHYPRLYFLFKIKLPFQMWHRSSNRIPLSVFFFFLLLDKYVSSAV